MRQADAANLSPRRIGAALRAGGEGVLALAEVANFEGLDDPLVFELAASQQRVLVTRSSGDFAPLAREWAEPHRQYAGPILIWTLGHNQFGEIIVGVERLIGQRSEQERWRDLVVALSLHSLQNPPPRRPLHAHQPTESRYPRRLSHKM